MSTYPVDLHIKQIMQNPSKNQPTTNEPRISKKPYCP